MRRTCMVFFFLSSVLLSFAHMAYGAVECVSTNNELTQVLVSAALSSEDDELRIVQGTYYGGFVYASTNGSNLIIEGGYTAGCVSRDADPTNTILDGSDSAPGLSLSSTGSSNISVHSITFQNGRRDPYSCGGGVSIDTSGGSVSIMESVIKDNVVETGFGGGGVCIEPHGGNVVLDDNQIIGNSSNGFGTGVKIVSAGTVIISENIFHGNQGSTGAGISLTVTDEATIYNNTFTANFSSRDGGSGIYAGVNRLTIDNNIISGGTRGGGIFVGPSSVLTDRSWTISNNVILNNAEGPGLRVAQVGTRGELIIFNNIIAGNSSYNVTYAGGVSVEGLYTSSSAVLTNNTIVDNGSSGDGGGLKIEDARNDSNVYINSNIIWNNTAAGIANDIFINDDYEEDGNYTPVEILGNDFDQSEAGFSIVNPAFLLDSSNIYNIDPLFVEEVDDYHLSMDSPCINAGNNVARGIPSIDQEGYPRIVAGIVDMGAYEYVTAGDVTGDGTVDLQDVITDLLLLTGGSPVGITTAGDVNGDIKIGLAEVIHGLRYSITVGDITNDGTVDLKDVIAGLQVLTGDSPTVITTVGDVDGDNKIGLAEVIYGLRHISLE